MRQALALCDAQGAITARAARQAEVGTILALMRAVGRQPLQQAVSSFAAGLAGYWDYYRQAEAVSQGLSERSPPAVVQALACGWQAESQSTNSKDSRTRQRLAQEAAFSDDYAASLLPTAAETLKKAVLEALDAEVRSSSLVENVNSALRPLLETCRGQVDQAMLDLFAYGHNHRRFVRGKRAGKAPIELLTGTALEQTWIESLFATV